LTVKNKIVQIKEIKMSETKNGLVKRLKSVKHIEFYVAGIAIGLMLLIYFSASLFSGQANANGTVPSQPDITFGDYQRRTESSVQRVVSSMRGVGKVEVAINWESSIELVIAYITINNNGNISSTPQLVTENGVTRPIVIKEIYPQALGVAMAVQGAEDMRVKLAVLDTVSIFLNIPQDKIVVQAM
jgi:stage III sporulation protein AG